MMNKILIAGGSGFIGSHLCNHLVNDKSNFIYCVDNFCTSSPNNIKSLENKENFKLINQSICQKLDLKVNQIYNLACPASPVQYQNLPFETMEACIDGSRNLLELATVNNATILQASTSEVYGDPLKHPQEESYYGNVNTFGPRSCYDEGKRMAETIFYNYKDLFKTNIRIARIFNTYGPNMQQNDGRVISNFIVQALEGNDITIYGDGTQTRSFCYIDDMVEGLVGLMNSDYQNPVNLGNNTEIPIVDIANIISEQVKSNSKIVFKEMPVDDPMKRKPDISLAKKLLGFNPKTSFSVGLEKTIVYFRKITNG